MELLNDRMITSLFVNGMKVSSKPSEGRQNFHLTYRALRLVFCARQLNRSTQRVNIQTRAELSRGLIFSNSYIVNIVSIFSRQRQPTELPFLLSISATYYLSSHPSRSITNDAIYRRKDNKCYEHPIKHIPDCSSAAMNCILQMNQTMHLLAIQSSFTNNLQISDLSVSRRCLNIHGYSVRGCPAPWRKLRTEQEGDYRGRAQLIAHYPVRHNEATNCFSKA